MIGQEHRFTCVLPLPSRDVSQNARGHWSKLARATQQARMVAKCRFRSAKPAAWVPEPVRLEVVYRCPYGSPGYCPRDAQNAIGALKAAIDGMVDAGVVPDDSAKWVTWGEFQLTREGVAGVYVTVVGRAAAVQASEGVANDEGDGHGPGQALDPGGTSEAA